MRRSALQILILSFLLAALPGVAQQIVNIGSPASVPDIADATMLPGGEFVVVWTEYVGYPNPSVVTAAKGTPGSVGTPFPVANLASPYASAYPKVDADGAGNFWVGWEDGGYPSAVKVKGFDSAGNPLPAGETTITGTYGLIFQDVGARRSSSGFVVLFGDYSYGYSASASGFEGSVAPFGPVNASGYPYGGRVGVDSTGNFIVVWNGDGILFGNTFDEAGNPLASLDFTSNVGSFDVAGLSTGNFVVVWGNNYGAYAQIATTSDTTPTPASSPISLGSSSYPWVGVDGNDSNFVVVWNEPDYSPLANKKPNKANLKAANQKSDRYVRRVFATGDVTAQAFTNGGSPLTGPFVMNSGFPSYGYTNPSVGMNNSGQFVVTWSGYSSTYAQVAAICANPVAPALVSPIGGAIVSSPVTFSWNAAAGAVSYDVYVGVGGAPTLQGSTAATTFGPLALADGAGSWYVIANFGVGCPTAQSAPETFTVDSCPTLSPPTLVAPPNGATVTSPVLFQWTAVAGATAYEVFAGVGISPSLVGTTSGTSLSVNLPAGTGDWYVVAKAGVSCPTASSNTGTFVVEEPFVCPTPSTPDLVAPADGTEFEVGALVQFQWTAASGASSYQVWAKVNGGTAKILGTTANTILNRAIEEGTTEWWVVTTFGPGCGTSTTLTRTISTTDVEPPPPPVCGLQDAPLPSIVAEATTGEAYVLRWDALDGVSKYRVQESANASFIGGIIQELTVPALEVEFKHPNLTQPTPFYYRVAGIPSCDENKMGPYSVILRVVGLPKPEPSSTNPQVVTEFGNEDFVETFLFIPGFGESAKTASVATFTASSNEPWLTVSPASGNLPPEGTTVGLIANPKDLGLGANTATVTVTRDDGLGKTTLGSTTKGVPVAVSLVTPVSPIPKSSGPPENALIIPAVANVTGIDSKWFSDVKITNRSGQLINYQLNFSATDESGFVKGKQTKVTIRPGQTVALDDVVRQWYGFGDLADGTNGALEIRPINFTGKVGPEAAPMLATVASSRTFTRQENSLASYGQFIPAVPFSGFLKAGVENSLLMMQQVSQTANLRTNFGLVEGSGKDVNVMLTAYDREGTKLGEFPVSLKAGEHKQLNSLLAFNNISVEDGRMTVQIVSGDGAVTSYASVVASGTGDPSLVPGVNPANLSAKKYVLPGVADLRIGDANWRSDIRIFNPNQAPESVNVFFYPQGETTPLGPVEIQIQPGQISVLPGVVESLFGRQDLGGALHVVPISGQATSLVITGETYDVSELGKYGQFIPAVTEENAIGVGSPGLEVMQVEESAQFRTNLGLAEVTGQQATVQIQLTVPNSLIAPTRTVNLGGNEFQQLNGIVREMTGGRDVYNGRLTVRVVGGTGKITAYGSTVDNQTRDATFSAGQ